MAKEMQALAYFRCRGNDKAPLFVARFGFDVEQMRKHQDFFECNADGEALDKVSVAAVKAVAEEAVEMKTPPRKGGTLRLGAKTTRA